MLRPSFICDRYLLLASIILLTIGILMVASTSMVISDQQFGYPMHFFFRQVAYVGLGLCLGVCVLIIKIKDWQYYSPYFLILSLLLLIIVLIPGLSSQINGSSRWINLGVFSVQVSEVMKIAMITFLAGYLVRRDEEIQGDIIGFIKPLALLGLVAILLLMEPDFGAAAVIMAVALGMMFLGGVRVWHFSLLLILVGSLAGLLIFSTPYRLARLTTFLNPWSTQFDTGYQLTQSLIAFGRGGIWGAGLGNSIQKLFYLPEAHTDFLFAVLAEEFGLIGQLVVCGLFVIIVGRALLIGRLADQNGNKYSAYVAYGLGLWIAFQALINIGVNLGVLPTKGLTLPLISYGGSSMLVHCVAIAILLRIYHEVCAEQYPN